MRHTQYQLFIVNVFHAGFWCLGIFCKAFVKDLFRASSYLVSSIESHRITPHPFFSKTLGISIVQLSARVRRPRYIGLSQRVRSLCFCFRIEVCPRTTPQLVSDLCHRLTLRLMPSVLGLFRLKVSLVLGEFCGCIKVRASSAVWKDAERASSVNLSRAYPRFEQMIHLLCTCQKLKIFEKYLDCVCRLDCVAAFGA